MQPQQLLNNTQRVLTFLQISSTQNNLHNRPTCWLLWL